MAQLHANYARMGGVPLEPKLEPSKAMQATSAAGIVGLVALIIGGSLHGGCAASKKDVKSAESTFLQCGKQDLTQLIQNTDGKTKTLLATVADDLVTEIT